MFFSRGIEKKLIIEIIILILFLIIIVPICASASSNYSNVAYMPTNVRDLYADLSENADSDYNYKVVSNKIFTIGNKKGDNARVSIFFKIRKYNNKYTLLFGESSFELDKLKHTEEGDYLYYDLGIYDINKESKINFKLIMENDISLDDSVSYSFIVEGI